LPGGIGAVGFLLVLRRAVRHDVVLADGFACADLQKIPPPDHKTANHKTGR
jgi:hypothetical protein